jgi:hypothetical protein
MGLVDERIGFVVQFVGFKGEYKGGVESCGATEAPPRRLLPSTD